MKHMKHIRQYESIDNKPQVGEYAMLGDLSISFKQRIKDNVDKFINSHIGKIIKINEFNGVKYYTVKYKDVPARIKDFFAYGGIEGDVRQVTSDFIKYHSFDKKEIEMMLDAEKYNI